VYPDTGLEKPEPVYARILRFVTVVDEVNGIPITSNGLPMTNDFDLAVYVKGDRKSTAVYNAQLIIEYEGEVPEDFDLALTELDVPRIAYDDEEEEVEVTVTNNGPDTASGTVTLTGITNDRTSMPAITVEFSASFTDLAPGEDFDAEWDWTVPDDYKWMRWTAVVTTDGGPAVLVRKRICFERSFAFDVPRIFFFGVSKYVFYGCCAASFLMIQPVSSYLSICGERGPRSESVKMENG